MKILLDGDSCDVLKRTETIAKIHKIPCHWYRTLTEGARVRKGYSVYHLVDSGPDTVDFAILSNCDPGDVVVTSDGGLAAMVLAKRAYAIHPHGGEYTNENIDVVLNHRYVRSRMKRRGSIVKGGRDLGGSPVQRNKSRYEDVLCMVLSRNRPAAAAL